MRIKRREFCLGLGAGALVSCSQCKQPPEGSNEIGLYPEGNAPNELQLTEYGTGLSRVVEIRFTTGGTGIRHTKRGVPALLHHSLHHRSPGQ